MNVEILSNEGKVLLESVLGDRMTISIPEFWRICQVGAWAA